MTHVAQTTTRPHATRREVGTARGLVGWGSVFAGAIIGFAVFALLGSLWQALAFGSNVEFFTDSIEWWIGGSAIFGMFTGGLLAGWFTGRRGFMQGLVNGMTVWGLLFIASLIVGVPSSFAVVTFTSTILWTIFWSLLIGLGAAVAGGVVGGGLPRPHVTDLTYEEAREERYETVDGRERTRVTA